MCTRSFVGTSASNPMVAGVIALAMEANPDITARDINAILALSGRIPTASASGISINGGGLLVSHIYGSGLLNAVRMVKLARNWVPLGPRRMCVKQYGEWTKGIKKMNQMSYKRNLYPYRTVRFTFTFNSADCDVEVIEMARVGMQWSSEHRGSIDVKVTSPSGQVAHLLRPRIKDHFNGKAEMLWKSLMHTGERCYGKWVVTVRDTGRRKNLPKAKRGKASGMVNFIGIELLGTLKSESAFEQNKHNIVKYWHPARLFAQDTNQAFQLNQEYVSELYDHDRWHTAFETMEN